MFAFWRCHNETVEPTTGVQYRQAVTLSLIYVYIKVSVVFVGMVLATGLLCRNEL